MKKKFLSKKAIMIISSLMFSCCVFLVIAAIGGNNMHKDCLKRIAPNADLEDCSFRSEDDLQGKNFQGANLASANFDGVNLANTDFSNADLTGADFSNANLSNAKVFNAKLTKASFHGAILSGVSFLNQDLTGADFSNTNLSNVKLQDAILIKANFQGAILNGVSFLNQDLTEVNFSNADLTNAILQGTKLSNVNFDGANLTGVTWQDAAPGNLIMTNVIGVTDDILISWLKVPSDQLAKTLSAHLIRLESRDDILSKLQSVCSGNGVPEAGDYSTGTQFHPIILINAYKNKTSLEQWEPMALRFSSIGACIGNQKEEVFFTCHYVGKDFNASIYKVDVKIFAVRSGQLISTKTVYGSEPVCPNVAYTGATTTSIHGDEVTYEDITNALESFVNPPNLWTGTADFGTFAFTVDATGARITKLSIQFNTPWWCGDTNTGGSITREVDLGGSITDGKLSLKTTTSSDSNDTMSFSGTYDEANQRFSGTWDEVLYGGKCSGTWEATSPK